MEVMEKQAEPLSKQQLIDCLKTELDSLDLVNLNKTLFCLLSDKKIQLVEKTLFSTV